MAALDATDLAGLMGSFRAEGAAGWAQARQYPRGKSGYRGVSWHTKRRKWSVRCSLPRGDGRRIQVGYFTDKLEAARAYDTKAREVFGRCAQLHLHVLAPPLYSRNASVQSLLLSINCMCIDEPAVGCHSCMCVGTS